jgi:arylsulfatase A-like enzyme
MTGVIRNGVPLPDDVPVLAERFQQSGYQTACIQSNWTLKSSLCGLDRGFDVYDDAFALKRGWFGLDAERRADEVTRLACERIESLDPARPFFLWVHYMDPHAPYRFHGAFSPVRPPLRGLNPTEQMRLRYDTEVAYTDHHLRALLDALPEDNTYIVFVADHGESLNEHRYVGHTRRVYQTMMRIPLILHGPGIAPGRSAVPARGIDLAPILLGLAGLPPTEGMAGLDLLQQEVPVNRVRVVETYGGPVPETGARAVLTERPPRYQGVLAGGWKLISGKGRDELYHVALDPWERDDRASDAPECIPALRAYIRQWESAVPRNTASGAALSEEDRDALKAAGYL